MFHSENVQFVADSNNTVRGVPVDVDCLKIAQNLLILKADRINNLLQSSNHSNEKDGRKV